MFMSKQNKCLIEFLPYSVSKKTVYKTKVVKLYMIFSQLVSNNDILTCIWHWFLTLTSLYISSYWIELKNLSFWFSLKWCRPPFYPWTLSTPLYLWREEFPLLAPCPFTRRRWTSSPSRTTNRLLREKVRKEG